MRPIETFSEWYDREVAPTLMIPPGIARHDADQIQAAARDAMAKCWNAALDACERILDRPNPFSDLRAKPK